jgi:hypothetical protein
MNAIRWLLDEIHIQKGKRPTYAEHLFLQHCTGIKMTLSMTKTKSIRFHDTMIEAVSLLKEKEDSFSSYIKDCVADKIEREHGIPINEITDLEILDRVEKGDFSKETIENMISILKSTLT